MSASAAGYDEEDGPDGVLRYTGALAEACALDHAFVPATLAADIRGIEEHRLNRVDLLVDPEAVLASL